MAGEARQDLCPEDSSFSGLLLCLPILITPPPPVLAMCFSQGKAGSLTLWSFTYFGGLLKASAFCILDNDRPMGPREE